MGNKPSTPKRSYTYADYCEWPDDERWELIDGEAFDMTPAPGRIHQKILGNLFRRLDEYFEGKACEVYVAPFDVRVPKDDEPDEKIKTVIQPDIVVVCDQEKLDDRGCRGAPSLVVEILSPSTASYDQIKKRRLYEKIGVKEFWVIQPTDQIVMVSRNSPKGFGKTAYYGREDSIETPLFPGLTVTLAQVFPASKRVVRQSPAQYRA